MIGQFARQILFLVLFYKRQNSGYTSDANAAYSQLQLTTIKPLDT